MDRRPSVGDGLPSFYLSSAHPGHAPSDDRGLRDRARHRGVHAHPLVHAQSSAVRLGPGNARLLAALFSLGFDLALAIFPAGARASTWQPSPGHTQLPIWPSTVSAGRPAAPAETSGVVQKLVAGRPWVYIGNVSVPTMTVYSPKGKNTGTAVIVFPGGGYQVLAIDLEGTEICDWLTSKGITAVLLKYRVPNSGANWDQPCGCDRDTRSSKALEDAQRTISLVRSQAAKWHIDPRKIGVIGFSAGGHMVASVSTRFSHRVYRPVDTADSASCRPDFAMALYPGHLFDRETS